VPGLRTLLRSKRILQLSLAVNIAANLGLGGAAEVALPSLARGPLQAGSIGYGSLLAALAAGGLLGTLAASGVHQARRPFMTGSFAFLAGAVAIGVVPYVGGTIAVGAVLVAFGVLEGYGNVVMITAFQQWAPPAALGKLIGLLMLTSYGVFPVSVALAALMVRDLGPAPFFPLAAACLAVAVLAALSQRTWRDFGQAAERGRDRSSLLAVPATKTDERSGPALNQPPRRLRHGRSGRRTVSTRGGRGGR
jgi:hypothetical protein